MVVLSGRDYPNQSLLYAIAKTDCNRCFLFMFYFVLLALWIRLALNLSRIKSRIELFTRLISREGLLALLPRFG
jgi:hypothetical protein